MDRSFDGPISDNSIIDEIIKSELQEINKTKVENSKLKSEIDKRQKILKLSDIEKQKLDVVNNLDVKNNKIVSKVILFLIEYFKLAVDYFMCCWDCRNYLHISGKFSLYISSKKEY